MELPLNKLKDIGLKCDIDNYFFGKINMEYFSFWEIRVGVKALDKEIEAINNMIMSICQREVSNFIGLMNYFCDMWSCISYTLEPFTSLTYITLKFK